MNNHHGSLAGAQKRAAGLFIFYKECRRASDWMSLFLGTDGSFYQDGAAIVSRETPV